MSDSKIDIKELHKQNPELLDFLYANAYKFHQKGNHIGCLSLINQILELNPEHCKMLYLQGECAFKNKNIPLAKESFFKLLDLVKSGIDSGMQPRKGSISQTAATISLCMYSAKENNDNEETHLLFQDLYNEYSKDKGKFDSDERDKKEYRLLLTTFRYHSKTSTRIAGLDTSSYG